MSGNTAPLNCFVAMFDIIGFRTLRQRVGTAGLHKLFIRGILPAIHHSAAGRGKSVTVEGRNIYVPDFHDYSVGFKYISDTVLFYTKDDSFQSFFSIVHSSFMLLQFGFSGGKAPYRGAIGWGDLINREEVFVGSSVEDAYMGESSQVWAGAMLTEACSEHAVSKGYVNLFQEVHDQAARTAPDEKRRRTASENKQLLVEYSVPLQNNPKDGPVVYSCLQTYALDWTIRMYDDAAKASFEHSNRDHEKRIVTNTIEFENWARAHNRLP